MQQPNLPPTQSQIVATPPSALDPASPPRDPDEINLLEYTYALVTHKWWIIGFTMLGLITGYVAALIKGPTWVADALIAPKENESSKSSSAPLGTLGFLIESRLNLGKNTSIEQIMLLLDSKDFNAQLIKRYNLLPFIFRLEWPKQYKKTWDSSKSTWKSNFVQPNPLEMGSFIENRYLNYKVVEQGTLTISVKSTDSSFSAFLAQAYLDFLNDFIKTNIQNGAQENIAYLNAQLCTIADPLLRVKLQELIASEIEKGMVVSKEAFKIVDPVFCYYSFKEKVLFPIFSGIGFFFIGFFGIIIIHAIGSSKRTPDDIRLINQIKDELSFHCHHK